jgi:phosphatidylserine/phosphatidylglycerophosphate/cardiolipin synthase-like enzyme
VIYEFTDPVIEKALVDARGRGITVQIVADYQASKIRDSVVPDLVARGIDIRLDKVHAVTHHKMLIVDDRSVELGSFNWTRSAVSRNAEDDILIRNVPELARKATVVWRACWDESIEPE